MVFFRRNQEEVPEILQDLDEIRQGIEKAKLPESVAKAAHRELEKLEKTDPSAAEYGLGLNYLEYLISLPWNHFTEDNLDLERAQALLDSRHYGLKMVKERILDYLAVRKLCSTQNFQVLVVDDESVARTNLKYILEKEGYLVDTAENGVEALEKLRSREFDLILTDLKMANMDGMQLLETVKDIAPFTKTVILTGYASVDTAVNAMRKGAAHFLAKPVKIEEIRGLVRGIQEKKKHIQHTRDPILCFTGPPGTGKTSVGKAIAEALGRKFVMLSLAGMRDEAELRGHRKTYVGAMPGRIIDEIRRLGVRNPLFMLDEIDKIGQDFRGDPASVLLEILDPEQNSRFLDYYLDVPFDLSSVIFIATANGLETLQGPLLDRLEVIPFEGYTEKEKLFIAHKHLIPRQLKNHGLNRYSPKFQDEAIIKIIRDYTREAGLRNLEREIATVCRKLARNCLESKGDSCSVEVRPSMLEGFLGPRKYFSEVTGAKDRGGVATGLVWTNFGGEIIFVESTIMRGSQQLILTGSLGSILQESAQTALSYIRTKAEELGIDPDFYDNKDIHIHIPAGAIPKDGPSAGLTIAMALISLLTGRPARRSVATTGELSLSGRILPVSGLREKLLAAQRAGVKTVILPGKNQSEVQNMESDIRGGLDVVFASELPEVIDQVLLPSND